MQNYNSQTDDTDLLEPEVMEPNNQLIVTATDEQILQIAPAALRLNLSDEDRLTLGRSKRYVFVSSQQVKEFMYSLGWLQSNIRGPKSKKHPDTCQHTMHFRNPDLEVSKRLLVGGLRPEILITNSHNGQAAFKFHLGLYRLVCENGLVVADRAIENFRVRHFSIDFDTIKQYMGAVTARMPAIMNNINTFKGIIMNKAQQTDFATKAMLLRNDKQIDSFSGKLDMKTFSSIYHPDELLTIQRGADESNDLFTVFNRIQENLIKGNYKHHNENGRAPKPLVENRKLLTVNKGLWYLMDRYTLSVN